MKTCSACHETKDLTNFYGAGKYRSGEPRISSVCKICHNLKVREWQAENKDKVRAYVRKSCKKAYDAAPDKYKEKSSIKRMSDPLTHRLRVQKSYLKKQANLDEAEILRRRKNSASWREINREKARENVRASRARHPERHANYQAMRRSKKNQATPKWLTPIQLAQLQEFYEISSAISMQTGILHHVDHICPLNGEFVKGLHVPWNLQILPASENIRKSNSLKGD